MPKLVYRKNGNTNDLPLGAQAAILLGATDSIGAYDTGNRDIQIYDTGDGNEVMALAHELGHSRCRHSGTGDSPYKAFREELQAWQSALDRLPTDVIRQCTPQQAQECIEMYDQFLEEYNLKDA
jgi:Mor family transcriptional regulator